MVGEKKARYGGEKQARLASAPDAVMIAYSVLSVSADAT
jgi:hypothetical protein